MSDETNKTGTSRLDDYSKNTNLMTNYERCVNRAKRKVRSEFVDENDWKRRKIQDNFVTDFDQLAENDRLTRVDGRKISKAEFFDHFDSQSRPVVITHLADDWPANRNWKPNMLKKKFGNERFKVGSSDRGWSVRLKMKHYMKYMKETKDDSPLYIFDSHLGEANLKSKLLLDYDVPVFFQEDFLRHAPDRNRPPHRWFVMGPRYSGTTIHIDPLGTSAWNTLLYGHKRWVLIPKEAPKELVKLKQKDMGVSAYEVSSWFIYKYPELFKPSWPSEYSPIEVLQKPGETIFVPSGWWHVVMNLDDTVAITQNYCNFANLDSVWAFTQKERPKFAKSWLKCLKKTRPDVASRIESLDEETIKSISSIKTGYGGDEKKGDGEDDSGTSSDSSSSSSSNDSESETEFDDLTWQEWRNSLNDDDDAINLEL